jgi:hypothetical protein
MGFYECVYNCNDDDYCVDCASSLDNFQSISMLLTCKKHKLEIGSVLKYIGII